MIKSGMTQSKFFLNFYFVMELKNPLIPQLLFATYAKQKKQRADYSGKIKQHPRYSHDTLS